jgi:recombination protein RecT
VNTAASAKAPAGEKPVMNGAAKPPQSELAKWETPTNKAGLEALSPMVKAQLVKALPSFMNKPDIAERMLRCLITECQTTPALLDCTPLSLFACAIKAGQLGLEIGGPLGRAYLLPFNNNKKGVKEAQLIVGYKGYIDLMHRSGQVKRITPVVVRKGDIYIVERGLHQNLIHKPLRGNVGVATDYYVVCELITGGADFEEFTVEQAIDFRNYYSTVKNAPPYARDKSPWYDIQEPANGPPIPGHGFGEMALKTLIRRIAKRTPMSAELNSAIMLEERLETGTAQFVPPVVGAGMPDLLGDGAIETASEKPKDKAEELAGELEAAKKGTVIEADALPDLIIAFEEGGGDWFEFMGKHGAEKMDDINKSKGPDRVKWCERFEAAIKSLPKKK